MNRLLVGTLVLSVMGAPLAFAQPDAAAQAPQAPQTAPRAPQSTNQVGPYNQDRAGQPGIPNAQGQTPPSAQGQANVPYPYGRQGAPGAGYQPNAAAPGASAYQQGGERGGGYNAGVSRRSPRTRVYPRSRSSGYRYHRLRVCRWRGNRRVCFWR